MKHSQFFRLVAVLCVGIMLASGTTSIWAAAPLEKPGKDQKDLKEVTIAGRVYDYNKDNDPKHETSPLHGVTVRIVNIENGQPREDETDHDGCYKFKDVQNGTYTVTVFYKGHDQAMAKKVVGEFLLPNKITVVRSPEKEILIKTCVALAEKNTLLLLEDCDLCGKVPVWIWIIPAAVVAGGTIGRGNEEETSPSRP
jgi:Carboxypeptidase regulatory-like domain